MNHGIEPLREAANRFNADHVVMEFSPVTPEERQRSIASLEGDSETPESDYFFAFMLADAAPCCYAL
jgi:hypothetical protein